MTRESKCKLLGWLWRLPVALLVLYLLALLSFSSEPKGAAASWQIFNHSPTDVIDFKNGFVTHRTCCGDSEWGTYSKRPDGQWVWSLVDYDRYHITPDGRRISWWKMEPGVVEKFDRKVHEVLVHPGLFSVTLSCETEPAYNATLRRRVFWSLPF